MPGRFAFESIDFDRSGELDREEMTLALEDLKQRVLDLDFTIEDINETFDKLDLDKTGLITHSQFVVATLDHNVLSDDVYLSFFKDLDTLNEGFLTKESIKIALRRKGFEISISSINNFLSSSSDIADGAHIDFDQFKYLIL